MPTGTGGLGHAGGGGLGRNGADQHPQGLFAEMEQVESRDGTYPATEGFCCLMQVHRGGAFGAASSPFGGV